jgi:hypothetical protein
MNIPVFNNVLQNKRTSKYGYLPILGGLLCLFFISAPYDGVAQTDKITLEVNLAPKVESAQILSITNLGVSRTGQGEKLVTFSFQNESVDADGRPKSLNELYFAVDITSSKYGNLVDLDQRNNQPFSMRPNQRVITNNNSLQDGVPGINESIRFMDDPLTSQGEELINSLEGQTQLPQDVYQVTVAIYHGANARSGGQKLASQTVTLGGQAAGGDTQIYLITPGGVRGTGSAIQTDRPTFYWDGSSQLTYRLLVVENDEEQGGSAETLISNAAGTDPNRIGDRPGSGELNGAERLDAIVENATSYQYPVPGAIPLEAGKEYFWQVRTEISTPTEAKVITSEIWSFTLAEDDGNGQPAVQISERNLQQLIRVVGQERFKRLQEDGYKFQAVEYDGQQYQAAAAGNALSAFLNRLSNEEITIVNIRGN